MNALTRRLRGWSLVRWNRIGHFVTGVVNFISFSNFIRTKKGGGGAKVTTTAQLARHDCIRDHRLISMKDREWERDSHYVAQCCTGSRATCSRVPLTRVESHPSSSHTDKNEDKIGNISILEKSYRFLIFNSITRDHSKDKAIFLIFIDLSSLIANIDRTKNKRFFDSEIIFS